jgi:hypothetical protein
VLVPPVEVVLLVRLRQTVGASFVSILCIAFAGCDRLKHQNPAAAKLEAKRRQTACASPSANDRLKNVIFDEAISERPVDRGNLDTLADYSVARMENPVVEGWDQSLDITRCAGRFILEVPPGAERGLGGARQLQADIKYTAQASADGAGLVYRQRGAEAIVSKLAAFHLGPVAYRPPPAIDPEQAEPTIEEKEVSDRVPPPVSSAPAKPTNPILPEAQVQRRAPTAVRHAGVAEQASPRPRPKTEEPRPASSGEQVVRSFYAALGEGNGAAAASHVIPEKRSSGPFSAGAISRFYGRLPEPLRLTSVTPQGGGYRVTYRYSAGRSHCSGVAVVRVTSRGGRDLISSIRSLSGC